MFQHPRASFSVPDGSTASIPFSRTTHLGIGAHPDDLEFMALHGILACFGRSDAWFGGITCTDGAGSVQVGRTVSGEPTDARLGGTRGPAEEKKALISIRRAEQEEAARIGKYGFIAQLGYSSAEAKDQNDDRMTRDLVSILSACRPQILYTHNPADKHETHIAVLARVVKALRSLPRSQQPDRLLGCEVWRDLDWLDDADKVRLDVSAHPELAEKLARCFQSQNEAKRYDLAVRGRAVANATFFETRERDAASAIWHAMDLTPLMHDDTLSIRAFTEKHISRFKSDVLDQIARFE